MGKKRVPISLRKPPSPEAVEAFVQGTASVTEAAPASASASVTESVSASASVSAPAPAPESAPASAAAAQAHDVVMGEGGRALRPVTVYLPVAIADRLAIHCLELDRDASLVVGEAIEAHLQRRLGPAPAFDAEPASPPRAAGAPFQDTAGPFGGWRTNSPGRDAAWAFVGRLERWIEIGRTLVETLRMRPRPA
jgi:hypothetical protein